MNRPIPILVMLAFLVTPVGQIAHAAETWSMIGSTENSVTSSVQPVDEDTVVIHVANQGTMKLDDMSNPLHGATGTCSGAVMVEAGKPSGNGLCTYTDADGETAVVAWTSESLNSVGGNAGSWQLVGGSGRWATASASGSYSDSPSEDRSTSVNTIDGELSMQ